ncbi:hypothetical protein KR222_004151 [Zaprionus bogoriensis]|nr:hypothetical protein KR222_004151 [Zaprionus bogoriensis]
MIASESEAINSATYVDNYLDSVENLPDDVQRQLSRIRDIDVQYRGLIRDVDHYYDLYVAHLNSPDTNRRSRSITRMHQSLIQAQELGDEKMQIVNHLQEIIDAKVRQLDTDHQNLDLKDERDTYILLDDGPPSKLQRHQSPMCDQGNSAGNGGLNSGGLGLGSGNGGNSVAKDHYGTFGAVGGTGGGASGNGGNSALTYDRGQPLGNGDSKRSRRRNESLVNCSSTEMGGNESNSANEAGSSGNGNGNSERKSTMASGGGGHRKGHMPLAGGNAAGGGGAGGGGGGGSNSSGKKKKRKVRGGGASNTAANAREETPPPEPIDPDEPTYCVCNQISFGEMILCDNDLCPIEWFHFSCVSLVLKPKGKWFCPNCRGERPNVMKPKAQFLKELERYNKEKEEKT